MCFTIISILQYRGRGPVSAAAKKIVSEKIKTPVLLTPALVRISTMTDRTESVAALVDDMFFSVKINSAVSAHGRSSTSIKSKEQLQNLAANPPALIIVDLN